MELELLNINKIELEKAFDEIQIPRTPYALRELVVNTKFTNEFKYQQCVLELQVAYDNLRIAKCNAELKEMQICKAKNPIKKEIKQIELEQLNRARLGAIREFTVLYDMFTKFPKYTREQIDEAAELEFKLKLETQAAQDIHATGRVSQGNQEGLRQIGITEIEIQAPDDRKLIE